MQKREVSLNTLFVDQKQECILIFKMKILKMMQIECQKFKE